MNLESVGEGDFGILSVLVPISHLLGFGCIGLQHFHVKRERKRWNILSEPDQIPSNYDLSFLLACFEVTCIPMQISVYRDEQECVFLVILLYQVANWTSKEVLTQILQIDLLQWLQLKTQKHQLSCPIKAKIS